MWLFIAPIVADPQSGLKEKTVKKHTGNIRFYINEFFNWFFPRKAMWSNVTRVHSGSVSYRG